MTPTLESLRRLLATQRMAALSRPEEVGYDVVERRRGDGWCEWIHGTHTIKWSGQGTAYRPSQETGELLVHY